MSRQGVIFSEFLMHVSYWDFDDEGPGMGPKDEVKNLILEGGASCVKRVLF